MWNIELSNTNTLYPAYTKHNLQFFVEMLITHTWGQLEGHYLA